MKNRVYIPAFLLISLMVITGACKSAVSKMGTDERPTRGHIRIGVDEAYQLLARAEVETFEGIYTDARIDQIIAPEDSILRLFLADSVRLMITSRSLTDNEVAYLRDKLVIARTTKIASDALALVVNKSNPDGMIQYNQIRDMFLGKISSWKQMRPDSPLGDIQVIFDDPGSSNTRMIIKKFDISTLPSYCYAVGSIPAVIDYVEGHPNAMGIIGVNWISDVDDSITHAFLDRVKVVGLTPEFDPESNEYYQPHPAYIADKTYPFIRDVYAISRETFDGLGSGFISFVSGDVGQRILLKMGMLPATVPVRLVQITNDY